MQKKLLIILSLLVVITAKAQTYTLSHNATVSVLTIDPGKDLNDAFGHNAFRIKDPSRNLDAVFDYGRFDFEAPHFYLNFARGKLNYSIGSSRFYDFIDFYKWQNRTVREQVLNINQDDKQKLFNYLVNNLKPENKFYLYDFFYDNCATKIRDVLETTSNENIQFNTPEGLKAQTFRHLIQDNLNRNSWGSLGIDLALGSVIDKTATPYEHMFLPKYIFEFFANATFSNSGEKLVKETHVLYKKTKTKADNTFLTSPLAIFGLIGLIILLVTYNDYKKQRRTNWLDVILFSLTGIIGVMILLLWFATDHKATHQNYNLLWAFALNILVLRQLFRKQVKAWFIKYLKFLVIMLCLLTLHWIIGIQEFAIGLIPFLIALLIRYIYLIGYFNKKLLSSKIEHGG
ncbi:membrane protein [Yeosuana aromativorans]|uniref:Membrane protein n=1 Tax=Yeosuana aromativorans TaxID=288019 RepID=A0A8J3BKE3_9FLAO|nr:DUF4105 domain-containing protein [Yeosuana aromativorans]GGK17338.1 membrane protein [Yeosuana aromativorans]